MEKLSDRGLITVMVGALVTSSLMVQFVTHLLNMIARI